jgi:hypothetical protein
MQIKSSRKMAENMQGYDKKQTALLFQLWSAHYSPLVARFR